MLPSLPPPSHPIWTTLLRPSTVTASHTDPLRCSTHWLIQPLLSGLRSRLRVPSTTSFVLSFASEKIRNINIEHIHTYIYVCIYIYIYIYMRYKYIYIYTGSRSWKIVSWKNPLQRHMVSTVYELRFFGARSTSRTNTRRVRYVLLETNYGTSTHIKPRRFFFFDQLLTNLTLLAMYHISCIIIHILYTHTQLICNWPVTYRKSGTREKR